MAKTTKLDPKEEREIAKLFQKGLSDAGKDPEKYWIDVRKRQDAIKPYKTGKDKLAADLRDLSDRIATDPGPFTGQGWTEKRKWIQEAKRATPKHVSPARIEQIIHQAAKLGSPWVNMLESVMTQGEYRYVTDHSDRMPGDKSWMDAFFDLRNR